MIEILINRDTLDGSVNLVGDESGPKGVEWGTAELAKRGPRTDLTPDPNLPDDTKLWAVLQNASGGVWGGCVYDAEAIAKALARG